MAIVAPLSRYKKKNMIIMTCLLIGIGLWFYYDGHYNQKFIDEHTVDGKPDSTLNFNRKSPPFFIGAGILWGIYLLVIKNKKIMADENTLDTGKEKIAYNTIQKINKMNFDKKGYFIVTYTADNGQSRDLKISDRMYDNVPAVLDHIVSKIS